MPPLRILFIAPYVPSLTRVRPFNLIKQLTARGHRVTVCAASTGGAPDDDVRALRPYCEAVDVVPVARLQSWWSCVRALPTAMPLQAMYGHSPRLAARVNELMAGAGAGGFDVVHVEHLRAALLAWAVKKPHVFDAVDCISQLFAHTAVRGSSRLSRWSARLDLPRTRQFERSLLHHFGRTLTTSADERAALLDLSRDTGEAAGLAERVTVLPNGVDLDYFQPQSMQRDPATLVFVGRMSYHANVSAIDFLVRDILPRVWRARPEVRLTVVGEDPQVPLRRLAAASGGRITLSGTVPDVRPHVARATIAVCPITYAVGIQNKVLEAMAMGTPVICTPAACRALDTTDNEHLLVAPDAGVFAAHITTLLDDTAQRQRLGTAARQYVEAHHDWRRSGERLEAIYREEIARYAAMSNER